MPLLIICVRAGKLGGQNKVPRLSNDRKIADQLKKYIKLITLSFKACSLI
jgi:hypothetical protein